MIGILIAIQLNVWKQVQNNTQESKEFIQRLSEEVRSNVQHTDYEITKETRQIKSSKKILELFNRKEELLSSITLDSLVFIIFSGNTMAFTSGTLTEGLNTGKIAII